MNHRTAGTRTNTEHTVIEQATDDVTAPGAERADAAQLLQLWFSPGMPTGAYSHGHGLEAAIAAGDAHDPASVGLWLRGVLEHGGLRGDAILMAAAWRCGADARELDAVDDLARALVAGRERLEETLAQGDAFAKAVAAFDIAPDESANESPNRSANGRDRAAGPSMHAPPRSLPVAIGDAAARFDLPLEATLTAALQASVANLAWIAARLVPLGQQATLGILASSVESVRAVASFAAHSSLDDLGNAALLGDIASLEHEFQYSRLCRT